MRCSAPGRARTRWWCSRATTAASASPTPGRSSARRWTCSRAAFASRCSPRGRRSIPPGGVSAQLAITMDWVATFLAAAGVKAHPEYPLDGIDLAAVLRDPSAVGARELFWRMNHRKQRAARAGDWKYLSMDGYEYFFNLARDARERANLARVPRAARRAAGEVRRLGGDDAADPRGRRGEPDRRRRGHAEADRLAACGPADEDALPPLRAVRRGASGARRRTGRRAR